MPKPRPDDGFKEEREEIEEEKEETIEGEEEEFNSELDSLMRSDRDGIDSSQLDAYTKEVLLSVFNLWQIARQHEDDLRILVNTLRENTSRLTSLQETLSVLKQQKSDKKTSDISKYVIIGLQAITVLLLIIFIFIRR